ncbi:hypothetical protein V1511DRAFT_491095 [Dipodascopsis uninucleata]
MALSPAVYSTGRRRSSLDFTWSAAFTSSIVGNNSLPSSAATSTTNGPMQSIYEVNAGDYVSDSYPLIVTERRRSELFPGFSYPGAHSVLNSNTASSSSSSSTSNNTGQYMDFDPTTMGIVPEYLLDSSHPLSPYSGACDSSPTPNGSIQPSSLVLSERSPSPSSTTSSATSIQSLGPGKWDEYRFPAAPSQSQIHNGIDNHHNMHIHTSHHQQELPQAGHRPLLSTLHAHSYPGAISSISHLHSPHHHSPHHVNSAHHQSLSNLSYDMSSTESEYDEMNDGDDTEIESDSGKDTLAAKMTRNKKGVYKCNHCSEKFNTMEQFYTHISTANVARPFKCTDQSCPWSRVGFPNRNECSRHIKHQHHGARYACSYEWCTKKFPRKDSRNRHEKLVHEKPDSRLNRKLMRRRLEEEKKMARNIESVSGLRRLKSSGRSR